MKNREFISTNIVKAVAMLFIILQHSLQYNEKVNIGLIGKKYGFYFWMYQAVGMFIVITGFHYAISYEKERGG